MVLVTGATGILGRVLVLELLKSGKSVRATKRPTSDLSEVKTSLRFYTENHENWFEKIEWVDADFDDIDSLEEVLIGVEEVYHCSAKVSFHPKDKNEMYKTNIEGTQQLLYACENSSVKKFLFVSSIAVLDGVNEEGEQDETCDFNSKYDHSDYAISKHFSEMEVWRANAEGLNTVIVNPGLIIGSGNWKNSSGTLFSTFEKSVYTFSGGTSYVDVRDVAKICIELMEKNIFGERFILISENKRYEDVGQQIRSKLSLSNPKILPKFLLDVGYFLNQLLGWAIPPLRMVNKVNIEAITQLTPISNQKIKDKLNFSFIPVRDSINFHIKNYKEDVKKK